MIGGESAQLVAYTMRRISSMGFLSETPFGSLETRKVFWLHIQSRLLGVGLDEPLTWGDFIAHERIKGAVGVGGIFHRYLKQCAIFGVHGRFPQLLWVHFAEPFVPLNFK